MKKYILAAMIAVTAACVSAQDSSYVCQKGSYLTLDLGGGIQNISYDIDGRGDKNIGFGFSAKLGYRYYFTKHFGIGLGIQYQQYSAKSTLNFMDATDNQIDEEGDTYELRSYLDNVEEKQKLSVINIPVGIYYQTSLSERLKLNIGLGAEFAVTDKSHFETTQGGIKTTRYFADDNVEFEDMVSHNLTTVSVSSDGDFGTKTEIAPFIEAGIMYAITPKLDFTAGIIGSYNVTDIYDDSNAQPLCYYGEYRGIMNSTVIDKSSLAQLGLQVGLRYRFGSHTKKVKDDNEPQPVVADNKPADNPQPKDTVKSEEPKEVAEEPAKEEPSKTVVEPVKEEVADSKPEPKDEKAEAEKELDNAIASIKPFEFESVGSTTPDNKQSSAIDSLAKALKDNPDVDVYIYGHTCDLGSLETNKRVGQQRADWMKNELIKRGVEKERLHAITKWYSEPLVPNTSEENRKKNRRVEIVIK